MGAEDHRLAVDQGPRSVASPLSEQHSPVRPLRSLIHQPSPAAGQFYCSCCCCQSVLPLPPGPICHWIRPISARTTKKGGRVQVTSPPECSYLSFPNTSPAFESHNIRTRCLSCVVFLSDDPYLYSDSLIPFKTFLAFFPIQSS